MNEEQLINHYIEHGNKENRLINIDCKLYKILNPDLSHMNEEQLINHYIEYGNKEKRLFNIDYKIYKILNPDLSYMNNEQLINHYIEYGHNENRLVNTDKINIFLYCSGKSGSSTLYNTFKNNKYKCIHIHSNEHYLQNYKDIKKYKSIFELIINNSNLHKNIFIIDCYRNPIERKISSFFQNLSEFIPNYKDVDIFFLIDKFNKIYLKYLEGYQSINEIMKYFNIDIFDSFNFDKKYNLLEYKNIKFIKLRFNDISIWNKILSNIFNKNIIIYNENLSKNKNYINIYKDFKNNYKVPKEYLEIIKNNKDFKIYNTQIEQDEYIKYWDSKSY
jgi:hypothetical protein